MSNNDDNKEIHEVLPKTGLLYTEQSIMPILCKPKILPLKSVTLEKLEKMQRDSQEMIKRQEEEAKLHEQMLDQQRLTEEEENSGGDVGNTADVLTL